MDMPFLLAVGLGATLVPALLAASLNYLCPQASPAQLGCLAAGVAPLLIAIYIALVIAAGFAEPQPRAPFPVTEFLNGLLIDAAIVLGTLAVGFLVARLVLSFLRRR